MYTIKAYVDSKEYTIHDARVKALTVGGNPYFEIGDNINGSATFKVFPTHPYYDKVTKLTTDIVIYRDDEPEFYGRVLYDDEDFSGTKKVFVEGELAFLCDSIQRPKVYHNISVKAYVQDLIDIHNAQVEERKQFVVGRVTVKDSNDSLYRYSNYEDTRTAFKEKLTSRLGGHLVIRHEDGLRILDYLSDEDYYTRNTQGIRFGKNMLDFSKNMDASDLATCIIPLGAKLDEDEQDPALEAISEQRRTIASVNGGVDYVTDDNAVKEYGKIYKTVTWDDVTVPENLKKKAEEYLKSVQFEKMVLELKAIDLNLTDESFQRFEIGNMIQCVSTPNGLDREFPLTKKKVYITSFKNNTVTLGDETSAKSYTSSNRQSTAEMEETIKSLPSKTEILQEALRSAQDLINKQVASGYAVHVPNEFIVADDVDYKNKAKNLWRWGLGGFAHYSQGYDGPIDGVALTMDGKINGEMLLVNSVKTESLDAGYRTSVETKISESETAAKNHADNKVRVAREEIENSISNLENKISLSVRSVKETVARKNYIVGGEQETLDKRKFTASGMPWHTGSTDKVKGTCGSPYSNTNGKEPFKFLGIEFALGQYVVRSDVILNGVYDAEADTYQQEIYTCYDCKYFATAINEHYKKLGYVIPDSGNAWKYIKNLGFDVNFPHIRMASEYGGDSNKRFGDAVHTGTRANGTREFLSLGVLWDWSLAGLRIALLNDWLGGGLWSFSARPSLTGRRGSVVDWASSMGVNLAA